MEKKPQNDTITPLKELPLSDDFMFGHIMQNTNICRMFLEALLQKKIARIEIGQHKIMDRDFNRGIQFFTDKTGTIYYIEMQTAIPKNLLWHAHHCQCVIDWYCIHKCGDYVDLPDTFVIFICTDDPFGYGLPVYQYAATLENCENFRVDDGSHTYFLNSAYTEEHADGLDPAIMEFLRCIRENDTDKTHYTTPLMVKICEAIEEIRNDPAMEAEYIHSPNAETLAAFAKLDNGGGYNSKSTQ